MVILFTTAALLAATIAFAIIQSKKAAQELASIIAEKDSIADALRAYVAKLERDEAATQAYITQLKSNLQSCTDRAKAAVNKAKLVNKPVVAEEKKAPLMAQAKKRVYTKKSN